MFIHTLWGQIGFWLTQAIIGLIASCSLFGQLAEEAHADNRADDTYRYEGIGCKLIGTIILGGIMAASAAPGFFWGGNWVYATLAPAVLAIIFQLAADQNRAAPLVVLELGAVIDGIALTGATIIPFALPVTAIVILVVTVVVIIATIVLGAFAEEEE